MQEIKKTYDVIIVGAGINGSAIALEMGLRGYKTLLIEKGMRIVEKKEDLHQSFEMARN
eukprot:COSAG01_NODE_21977_length_877_cov_1.187661_1_plen_58_part_10